VNKYCLPNCYLKLFLRSSGQGLLCNETRRMLYLTVHIVLAKSNFHCCKLGKARDVKKTPIINTRSKKTSNALHNALCHTAYTIGYSLIGV
jgi:hypothetical protein